MNKKTFLFLFIFLVSCSFVYSIEPLSWSDFSRINFCFTTSTDEYCVYTLDVNNPPLITSFSRSFNESVNTISWYIVKNTVVANMSIYVNNVKYSDYIINGDEIAGNWYEDGDPLLDDGVFEVNITISNSVGKLVSYIFSINVSMTCDNNNDCTFCRKCVGGNCIYQNNGEDLKSECAGSTTCNGNGVCNECDTNSNCALCKKCVDNQCINQNYGEDLKSECDYGCNGEGICYPYECVTDNGCGLCQKCVDNKCVLQNFNEDLKNECSGSLVCNGDGVCSNNSVGWCYQEISTSSSDCSVCGCLATGNYRYNNTEWINIENFFDGDWETYASWDSNDYTEINFTYMKPLQSSSLSKWRVKGAKNFISEVKDIFVTIPQSCWNYKSDRIILKLVITDYYYHQDNRWFCQFGNENWEELYEADNLCFGGGKCENVFDEAMKWNINYDCGFCKKYSGGQCINQRYGEDLNNECDGYCNGMGKCNMDEDKVDQLWSLGLIKLLHWGWILLPLIAVVILIFWVWNKWLHHIYK